MIPSGHPGVTEILNTKLEVPLLTSRMLQRFRLIRLLQNGLNRRVTLVAAPAGYGKTTLLSAWSVFLSSNNLIAAWVSLDTFDNVPLRLWSYITSSVRKAYPRLNFNPKYLLHEGYNPEDFTIFIPLLNEIARIGQPVYLILDDYQVITDEKVHKSISYLIEHQPTNLHLILAGRSIPPIPLARYRAQGQVLEINAQDMAFDLSEAKDYFAEVLSLDLSPAIVQSILENTEGWVTGLQLVGLSYKHHPNNPPDPSGISSGNRHIYDFFIEEVLQSQPPGVQNFLLQTAYLTEFSAPLCDAVTGTPDSRETLRRIEQDNLFIVRQDEQGAWFRYHPLFAKALQNQMERTHPEQIPELHRRAYRWLLGQGYSEQAVNHAMAAGDIEEAAKILDACAKDASLRFDGLSLFQWINRFSDDMINRYPQLGIHRISFAMQYGPVDQLYPRIQQVENALKNAKKYHISSEQKRLVEWELKAVKAMIGSMDGDNEQSIAQYEKALENPPSTDVMFYGVLCFSLGSENELAGHLEKSVEYYQKGAVFARSHRMFTEAIYTDCKVAGIRKNQGRLDDAAAIYRQSLGEARKSNLDISMPLSGLLEIAVERQEFAQAREWVDDLTDNLSRIETYPSSQTEFETLLIRLGDYYLAVGEYTTARTCLDKALNSLHAHMYPSEYPMFRLFEVRVRLLDRTGELKYYAEKLRKELLVETNTGFAWTSKKITLARIEMALNHPEEALVLLEEIEADARQAGAVERLMESLVLQALVYLTMRQDERVCQAIDEALEYAVPAGYQLIFLREGKQAREVLEKYLETAVELPEQGKAAIKRAYAETLLFSSSEPARPLPPKKGARPAVITPTGPVEEPLSARELEVLALLAEGKSRKEIASTLVISENTLKTHTKNVYRKLGSHNRAILYQHAILLGLQVDDDPRS